MVRVVTWLSQPPRSRSRTLAEAQHHADLSMVGERLSGVQGAYPRCPVAGRPGSFELRPVAVRWKALPSYLGGRIHCFSRKAIFLVSAAWNARIYPACCWSDRAPGLDGSPLPSRLSNMIGQNGLVVDQAWKLRSLPTSQLWPMG
jgi:hypothetical protein